MHFFFFFFDEVSIYFSSLALKGRFWKVILIKSET